MNFLEKATAIETVILDVDGVLTDGKLYCSPEGAIWRNMHARDGYALQAAIRSGLQLVIITSGSDHGVLKRLEKYGVHLIYEGVGDKLAQLMDYADSKGTNLENTIFVGDDIPDYEAMQACGFRACPLDAAREIRSICHYVSPKAGGQGCVRDIIEMVLRAKGQWFKVGKAEVE